MSIRLDHGEDALGVIHDINVTPFIDVILVLLIIFMIAAPLATVDVAVDLPTSNATQTPRPQEPIFLTIKSDLSLALGDTPVSRANLQSVLDAKSNGDRTQRVYLRADKSVAYGSLMDTMNELRIAGYLKVALVGLEFGVAAMTALAMPAFDLPFGSPRRDTVRWGICFALVIAAHVSIALTLLLERPQEVDFGIDAPVVLLDLPPGPKQEEVEETPKPEEETKPPETETEVALPEPPKPEPPKEQQLASAPPPAAVVHNWESLLVSHIERFKRYPFEARERGEQGIVRVAFLIDRDGWVRSSRIVRSSGSSDLDQEALAMLTRAQPMPRPPERIPTRELSFQVPIKFTIR